MSVVDRRKWSLVLETLWRWSGLIACTMLARCWPSSTSTVTKYVHMELGFVGLVVTACACAQMRFDSGEQCTVRGQEDDMLPITDPRAQQLLQESAEVGDCGCKHMLLVTRVWMCRLKHCWLPHQTRLCCQQQREASEHAPWQAMPHCMCVFCGVMFIIHDLYLYVCRVRGDTPPSSQHASETVAAQPGLSEQNELR